MRFKTAIVIIFSLLPFFGFAQKAYETERYTAKVDGVTAHLKLANGYIGASQITVCIPHKKTPVQFTPNSGVPDEHNKLTFKSNKQTCCYFILNNMQEAYEQLPAVIEGAYFLNERALSVKFYLRK